MSLRVFSRVGTGGGGLTLNVREGSRPGYCPFSKASELHFCIKSNSTGPGDISQEATPKGQVRSCWHGLKSVC